MDRQLSIASLCFVKYFFALYKLNYARMIPKHLAEMSQLEGAYQEIWSELSNGNRVVNKNTIPFCAIGPDHALEHESVWSPCWHNTELNARN